MVEETQRLILEKFSKNDAPFFLELVNSPNWIKYIGDRNTKTIQDAEKRIENGHLKSYNTNDFGFYKVLLKAENNKPIGTCGIIKRDELPEVDLGFAFLPEYEGLGFGFEASEKVIKLAKNKFNLKKLIAIVTAKNKNSTKLLRKLGFVFKKDIILFDDASELQLFAKKL
ncbi:GNAT family N-acetyltransferase [Neotamlana laminarinivorans]|uniref:GNAT family N-acetyltransferase n=1 Tax=Neotamlana laminarinivorans TaxID=2883124 RepID=A0A9X1HY74_9FLAO|nr:GNAT family N-acetyltransferase [Tamlana laminarinivorans]MCB4798070.1 GNAT family N-acetyltransferase [Tamlana laminarinivorans]